MGKSPCYSWANQLFLRAIFQFANCKRLPEGNVYIYIYLIKHALFYQRVTVCLPEGNNYLAITNIIFSLELILIMVGFIQILPWKLLYFEWSPPWHIRNVQAQNDLLPPDVAMCKIRTNRSRCWVARERRCITIVAKSPKTLALADRFSGQMRITLWFRPVLLCGRVAMSSNSVLMQFCGKIMDFLAATIFFLFGLRKRGSPQLNLFPSTAVEQKRAQSGPWHRTTSWLLWDILEWRMETPSQASHLDVVVFCHVQAQQASKLLLTHTDF